MGITAIAPLSEIETLISDSGIPPVILQEIRVLGVNVLIADKS
jgi:DeoR/GlpR family transcriptional regulator of sugar metabolism